MERVPELEEISLQDKNSHPDLPSASPAHPPPVKNENSMDMIQLTDRESSSQLLRQEPPQHDEFPRPDAMTLARARFQANPVVRIVRRFGHNALGKLEDIGIGLLGVTQDITDVGGGVGKFAVSGVGAMGQVVQTTVASTIAGVPIQNILPAIEVDTVTEVDISGTILRDLNRAIEVEQLRGTSNAESPLNTPWILLIVPMIPIVFMYTKTAMDIALPPVISFVVSIWSFVGWRIWLCLFLTCVLAVLIAWDTVKKIEPLRPYTMLVDVRVIKLRRQLLEQTNKQMPKIYKVLDRFLPPLRVMLHAIDVVFTPRLGYSPLLALKARFNGWIYDPKIREIVLDGEKAVEVSRPPPDDVGHSRIVVEEGVETQFTGLAFDRAAAAAAAEQSAGASGAGELFEEFFQIEVHLGNLSELHRPYTSVWLEWTYRGMVVDRSVTRDIGNSPDWSGFGASFEGCVLKGEIRLPLQADTTTTKGGFHDEPIRLVLKGRDGVPLYSNDGARRYMRDSPATAIIGEIELSSLKIGVGTYSDGIVRSELRIPFRAMGSTQYRAAVLHATTRIVPVDSSSYSYRQMLSPLPNGEWTVRVNVFELRNLRGVDNSGSSDPYVSVGVMGMEKRTDRQRQTLSCMVNQLLFFSKVCTGLEFEDEKIVIQVMDWNRFSAPQQVGVYTMDAKRILELPGQELYRKWFALQDPKGGKNPAGFIKMSITVVRPGGSPPQHDDMEDREEFSSANLLKNTVLRTPKMSYENWRVHITIGWADMLPRMSTGYRDAIRGYITLSYSGYPERTTKTFIAEAKDVIDPNIGEACVVMPQRRCIWNEEYILPLTIINGRVAQEGIQLKLYHRTMPRLDDMFRGDLLIGQVNVSFEELFQNTGISVIRGQMADGEDQGDRIRNVAMMKPRYYNFYGMPFGKGDPYDKGVAFRGRVLIGVGAKPGEVSTPFLRQCPPPPRPRLDFYKLDCCVLQATELPLSDGWSVQIEGRIGLHQFGHTIPNAVVEKMCVQWGENCAVSIPNMYFPEDVEQIPDLFVTLSARKSLTVAELEEKEKETPEEGDETKPANIQGSSDTGRRSVSGPRSRISGASDDGTDTGSPGRTPRGKSAEAVNENMDWAPIAFLRLPAKHLICSQTEPRWMFMDYPGNNVFDADDTKVPGSILIAVSLSKHDPTAPDPTEEERESVLTMSNKGSMPSKEPQLRVSQDNGGHLETEATNEEVTSIDATTPVNDMMEYRSSSAAAANKTYFGLPLGPKRLYTLRAYIIQGRNLPAADESGLSDPMVTVSMGNQFEQGSIICKQTVSPLWQDLIEVKDITIRDGERKPNVNVLVYDHDDDEGAEAMQYLGRSIISSAELDVAEPTLKFAKWYPVFSVNPGVIVGEILADFQLVPNEMALAKPIVMPAAPPSEDSTLRVSLLGLRDVKFLKYAAGDIFVECSISCPTGDREKSRRGEILQHRAYEANCNILDVLMLEIQIPGDLRLAPALTVQVYAEYAHSPKPDLIATSCINLEMWLSEHARKLLSGENLIDDSFGMDAPVSERLFENGKYNFLKRARRIADENIVDQTLRLHELKAQVRSEKKNLLVLEEKAEVIRVGFSEKLDKVEKKRKAAKSKEKAANEKDDDGSDTFMGKLMAPIRSAQFQIADTMADLMPDVAMALGIEVDENVPLSALVGSENDTIDYDGTRLLKQERGFCPVELEAEFSEPAYGEFLLFRGDNRSLGNTTGRMSFTQQQASHNLPPVFPLHEAPSYATLVKREKRRTALEGSRPAVGKLKARLDLVEVGEKSEVRKARISSLRSFGRVFTPTEVVVRVYVLRGVNLQQVGPACNPYLTCRFYGGYPDFESDKHNPIMDDDNPNFFRVFQSRVKMPGGSIRIEVKDRMLPEITLPVAYPKFLEGSGYAMGLAQKDIPVNVGKLGLGWSENIGETVIDLDARWYNSAWRSLAQTPVEMRSLFSEDSANLKGHLEMFVDIFDAAEVDRRPKLYRPIPISKPAQENFELRVVVYKIRECYLPYKLANGDPNKLANFYIGTRLGNRPEDVRKVEPCKYVGDGSAEFNWRMKWKLKLPSLDIKPRLKLSIFDDTSMGIGDDQLCAVCDIKLRSLFDEIVSTKTPILKKKQWIVMTHPNHPDVAAQVQISLELTTEEIAMKKICLEGKDGYKENQHEDYVLPEPFQPAPFSILNPQPYFSYLLISTMKNLQLSLVTVLLISPFIPMAFQFIFMHTPWTWYAAGGVAGALVFLRIALVSAAQAARAQYERTQGAI